MRWVASEPVDLGLTPEGWSLGYRNGILDLPSRWRAGRETGRFGCSAGRSVVAVRDRRARPWSTMLGQARPGYGSNPAAPGGLCRGNELRLRNHEGPRDAPNDSPPRACRPGAGRSVTRVVWRVVLS